MTDLDTLDVEAVPRADLPALLGCVVRVEAQIRLRLAEVPSTAAVTSGPIDATAAAAIANTTPRWLLHHTKGMRFRCDLSRKQPRFDEAGLRAWLATRRR